MLQCLIVSITMVIDISSASTIESIWWYTRTIAKSRMWKFPVGDWSTKRVVRLFQQRFRCLYESSFISIVLGCDKTLYCISLIDHCVMSATMFVHSTRLSEETHRPMEYGHEPWIRNSEIQSVVFSLPDAVARFLKKVGIMPIHPQWSAIYLHRSVTRQCLRTHRCFGWPISIGHCWTVIAGTIIATGMVMLVWCSPNIVIDRKFLILRLGRETV